MPKFRYLIPNPKTPKGYVCSKCQAKGVKLWRQYQTFADNIELMCAACAANNQSKDISTMGKDGRHKGEFGIESDQIGWLVPAVPTVEGDTFWGYSSVPQDGCDWWHALPVNPRLFLKV